MKLIITIIIGMCLSGCSSRAIISTKIPCPTIPTTIRLSDNDLSLLSNRTYSIVAENDLKLSNWIRKVKVFCR